MRGGVLGGRFVLERPIGRGGMGAVWSALDRETDARVAVKIVGDEPWLARSARVAERFDREAALLATLKHPAIVGYIAHGVEEDGRRFLAMEWIDGVDLEKHLSGTGPLATEGAVALARALADALACLHDAGIVHRDVKPANILLADGDIARPKLLDLGVATVATDELRGTGAGTIVGTLGYMSPEQARGGAVDSRSDVFSLGCVLFECLSGFPAFTAENPTALALKILVAEIPALSESGVTTHPLVERLLARMLAKDEDARPDDGRALSAELEQISEALAKESLHPPAVAPLPGRLTTNERRVVTALLVPGVVEATPLDATLDAEPVTDVALAPMLALATEMSGRIAQLRDGTVLVYFEGIGSARDQAVRAARVALEAEKVLGPRPAVVATGIAELAGYLPTGAAIDRAAELLTAARPGEVAVDDLTARFVGSDFVLDETVTPTRLVAERSGDARVPFSLLGKPSRLVGRDALLEDAAASIASALARREPLALTITGPSGIGKTRFLHELAGRSLTLSTSASVWRARGDPGTTREPWSTLVRALRAVLGSAPDETPSSSLARIAERFGRGSEGFPLAELIAELLRIPVPDPSPPLLAARDDPRLMGDQVRRAITAVVRGERDRGPLVLLVDDVPAADAESLELLAALLPEPGPLAIVAAARTDAERDAPWEPSRRVALPPLPREARLAVVESALGAGIDAARASLLAERSEGNPFWLEELVRSEAAGPTDDLPPSVVASVQSRLERLAPDARRFLRAASVFGASFPLAPVAALAGLGPLAATSAVRALAEADALSDAGDGRLELRHDVVRRAAHAMLTDDDRRAAHAAAAAWLESEGALDPRVVADHYEHAGLASRAVPFLARAADEALSFSDFEGARTRASRALTLATDAPTRCWLHHVVADAAYWAGDGATAVSHAAEARALAEPGTDRWLDASRILSAIAVLEGRMGDVLATARSTADAAPLAGHDRAFAGTCARLASHTYLAGDPALAGRLLERAEAALAASTDPWPLVEATIHDARARRAELARDHAAERRERAAAAAAFQKVGDRRRECVARTNLGVAEMHLGLNDASRRSLEDARVTALELHLGGAIAAVECNLGLVLSRLGERALGRAILAASAARSRAAADKRFEGSCAGHLAQLELADGRPEAALRAAAEAAELLADAPTLHGYGLATLADALLAAGDPARALPLSEQALAHARTGELEEGDIYTRVVHAKVALALGRTDEARTVAREAASEVVRRAAFVDGAESREAFLHAVPEHAEALELAVRLTA